MNRLATVLLAGILVAPAVLACGACAPDASAEPTAAVTANHTATHTTPWRYTGSESWK